MNKYYSKNDISFNERLVDFEGNLLMEGVTTQDLTKEQQDSLAFFFGSVVKGGGGHRCISVYRDVVHIPLGVFHICFSCGDFIHNGKTIYLTNGQKATLRTILNL